ncbi:spore gernimation protein [Paenibacillus sp. 1011MAR3C5]|uniref:GerAB/ArcD/ProY family transporter n=1 Tax=Paenibacillus sp. 1011MAR3C5 TaxID=1675787 RepID=UPI000E6B771D|nr:endospore germination permease [Paenibacillus sp. 1011MAR3C5]RJE86100.1 spore gernimation protein [Paenibacillus sp. 1011MAR3C5]
MKMNVMISGRQFALLAAYISIGDSMLVLPSIPTSAAKQNGWVSALIGLCAGLLVVWLLSAVGRLYPRLTLVQYVEKLFGKWPGKLVSLCFISYLFLSLATHTREIGDFMTTQMMPETPIQAIHIMYVGILVMAARLGMETIARTGEFFFAFLLLFLMVFFLFLIPDMKINHLLPFWEGGLKPIIRGSITMTAYPFMELAVLLMVMPSVRKPEAVRSHFLRGALFGGTVLLVIILLSILVLGPDYAMRSMYPSYALAKKIDVGNFFQRLEVLLAFMWLLTSFIKSAVYFNVLQIALAQMAGLRSEKGMELPFGMLLVFFALLVSSNIIDFHEVDQYWPYMDMTFSVILPLAVLAAYGTRRAARRR